MKSATKAKVLREAVNRLLFLENLASKLFEIDSSIDYHEQHKGKDYTSG